MTGSGTGAAVTQAAAPAIRSAAEPDLPALVGLLGLLFALEADFEPDAARQAAGLRLMLAEPERRAVLVAERGGRAVGMVTVQLVVSTAEGAPSAWVEDLVVAEAERGQGTGRALLEAAAAWSARRGATRWQLLVDEENHPALGFYRRLGWQPTQLRALRGPARGLAGREPA